jgi:hypothetical protein
MRRARSSRSASRSGACCRHRPRHWPCARRAGRDRRRAERAFGALPAAAGATLVELPSLSAPYIEQDWARWHDALAVLERDWFAPSLAALQNGELAGVEFTLCGDTSLRHAARDARRPAQVLAPPRAGVPVRMTASV